eukprot:4024770-Pyramimonas_sp.AAC.1
MLLTLYAPERGGGVPQQATQRRWSERPQRPPRQFKARLHRPRGAHQGNPAASHQPRQRARRPSCEAA